MLDTYGYKHTLRICNNYLFSSVTMVTGTRLSVNFIRLLFLSLGVKGLNILALPEGHIVFNLRSQYDI